MSKMNKSDVKYFLLTIIAVICTVYLFSTGHQKTKRNISAQTNYDPYKHYDTYFQPVVLNNKKSETLPVLKNKLLFIMNKKNDEFIDYIENVNNGKTYKNVVISILSNVISESRKNINIYRYDYNLYRERFELGERDDMTILIDSSDRIKFVEYYLLQSQEIRKLLERYR